MLVRRAFGVRTTACRHYATGHALRPVTVLRDPSIETFRREAFDPAIPAQLPPRSFDSLPAIQRWFTTRPDGSTILKRSYLNRYGSTIVPLEFSNEQDFSRSEQALSFFLECVNASTSSFDARPNRYFSAYVPGARAVKKTTDSNDFFSASTTTKPTTRIYLAQAAIANLPQGLRDDVPVPDVVLRAGKGDVYDSSIWLGEAPTYTPLHRDPNPNLFVQLAGKKVVRLFPPHVGRVIFAKVQEKIGAAASETMRGEEMMRGAEKQALETGVWGNIEGSSLESEGLEAEMDVGDGLFIPKGWWHSVKSAGDGMIGSVNWWFR